MDNDFSKPKKVKQTYNIRDVIREKYSDEIKAANPYTPGDKEFVGNFGKALNSVMGNLNDDELKEAEELTDLWNEQGPPADFQLK